METSAVPAALLALSRTAPAREAALADAAAALGDIGAELLRWARDAADLDAFAGRVGAAFEAADDEPTTLYVDPSGDGQIIEVYGDLESATSIAIVVPGMESTLANEGRGLRQNAKHLY